MRQPRLFISSSLADRSITSKLADYLRRAYDEVWYDANRYGGEVWWEDILWNIKASDIFIYLLSPASVAAAYCRAEYAEAQRLHKQILPVVIRAGTHVPPDLVELQPVDLSNGLTSAKVGELLAALKQLENQFPKAPPVPANGERTPVPAVIRDSPRRFSRRWILPVLGILLVLALLLAFGQSGSVIGPTALPSDTVAQSTPTVEILPTSGIALTSTPTNTPLATYTASVTSTNTSTVPPTVTRRFSATPGS